MTTLRQIVLAVLFVGLSATGASALTERQRPPCTDYLDGARNVPEEQAALLPAGGMLRICRFPKSDEIDSLTIYPAPHLVAEDICVIEARTSGRISRAETFLAQTPAGVCPAPNSPFYAQANGVPLPIFRQARQIFSDLLSIEGAKASFVPEGRVHYDSPALRLVAVTVDAADETTGSGFFLIVGISFGDDRAVERIEVSFQNGEWVVTDIKSRRFLY